MQESNCAERPASGDASIDNDGVARRIASIQTLFVGKPPCCLEFAPLAPDHFIVGTYNLVQDAARDGLASGEDAETGDEESAAARRKAERNGSLLLCRIVHDEIQILQTTPVESGILDIHFSPHHPTIFAIATSIGEVQLWELKATPSPSSAVDSASASLLKRLGTWTYMTDDNEVLVTSLAWSPHRPDAHGTLQTPSKDNLSTLTDSTSLQITSPGSTCQEPSNELAITLTSGEVGILSIPDSLLAGGDATAAVSADDWHFESLTAHSLEAWTTIFWPRDWPLAGVLSGGDDAVLACSALSQVADEFSRSTPTWSNRKIHGAGVTAILPLRIDTDHFHEAGRTPPHVLLTGSYDDHLRVLSIPGIPGTSTEYIRQPQILHEINLEGGVWRLKLIDESHHTDEAAEKVRYSITVLVSCMYAGAKIVDLSLTKRQEGQMGDEGEWTSTVLATFEEHESMCYACDVRAVPEHEVQNEDNASSKPHTIISSSFYDKRLCLWKYAPEGQTLSTEP